MTITIELRHKTPTGLKTIKIPVEAVNRNEAISRITALYPLCEILSIEEEEFVPSKIDMRCRVIQHKK